MYSEGVVAVTTAEQRETILAALTEAGNWMEDDGYFAETSVSLLSFFYTAKTLLAQID